MHVYIRTDISLHESASRFSCRCTQLSGIQYHPAMIEGSCVPWVPAPGHCRRVFHPQHLQAAVRSTGCIRQLLALQACQGGSELCCHGWRVPAVRVQRQASQGLLHLSVGNSSTCEREYGQQIFGLQG